MKTTTATKKKFDSAGKSSKVGRNKTDSEEEVAVIVDVQTGAEYYMFPIDFFQMGTRSYAVMIPYEPGRRETRGSELVILRSQISKNSDQLYISIRDKRELERAFEFFFKRFEEASFD